MPAAAVDATFADLAAEIAVERAARVALEAEVADLRSWRAWAEPVIARLDRKPRPLSPDELATLVEIAGLVKSGTRFQVGELPIEPDRADHRGRVLARAARLETVGRYRVKRLPRHAGSAAWVIYVVE